MSVTAVPAIASDGGGAPYDPRPSTIAEHRRELGQSTPAAAAGTSRSDCVDIQQAAWPRSVRPMPTTSTHSSARGITRPAVGMPVRERAGDTEATKHLHQRHRVSVRTSRMASRTAAPDKTADRTPIEPPGAEPRPARRRLGDDDHRHAGGRQRQGAEAPRARDALAEANSHAPAP